MKRKRLDKVISILIGVSMGLSSALASGFMVGSLQAAQAVTGTATWTTKGDFENNAGTTGWQTNQNNIDISGINPGDDASVTLSKNNSYDLLGADFAISADGGSKQHAPSIAYNSNDNQYVVVWSDLINDNWRINARIVKADGTLEANDILIADNFGSGGNDYPSVAYNSSDNEYMITWGGAEYGDIRAQRVNADGTLAGSNFIVAGRGILPVIAYNSTDNQYLIAWQDYRNTDGHGDVYAQRVNADGTLAGFDFVVFYDSRVTGWPAIAYNSVSNQFMIAYDNEGDVCFQRVNADGTLEGDRSWVSDAFYSESNPSIAYNSVSDQFMITWEYGGMIGYRRINADGTRADSFPSYIGRSLEAPSIAYSPTSNQFMITYNAPNAPGILSQGVSADGTLEGPQIAISTAGYLVGQQSSIAFNPNDDQFMVIWNKLLNGPSGSDSMVYAQRVGKKYLPNGGIFQLELNAGDGFIGDWSNITWNGSTPSGTEIIFRTRGADSEADLASAAWSDAYTTSGSQITTSDSQWLEIEVSLNSISPTDTPKLYDFSIDYDKTAVNQAPLADAGIDQTVHVGSSAALDGSGSSDPDGDPLTYDWQIISAPPGSWAVLSDQNTVNPTLVTDVYGDYVVKLVVTDSNGLSSQPDMVIVSTSNSAPIADAGPDQFAQTVGSVMQLDGSQSYDVDGDPLTYQWRFVSKPGGSNAALNGATSARPIFVPDVYGTYEIELAVSDRWGQGVVDTMVVSFENVKPVANAGASRAIVLGETASLDGSQSADANGDPLSYNWQITSAPSGSTVSINDPTAVSASFVPDLPGVYVVQLIVNDGLLDSEPSTIQIQVTKSLQRELSDLIDAIGLLDPGALKNANMKNALLNKLNTVVKDIDAGAYKNALDKLENDILPKTDGWATIGRVDNNDWITDIDAQKIIYPLVINVIAKLKTLI